MASVSVSPAKTEVVVVKPETVSVELTRDEALVLHALIAHTQKSSSSGLVFDPFAISSAFRNAGVDYYGVVTVEADAGGYGPLLSVRKK